VTPVTMSGCPIRSRRADMRPPAPAVLTAAELPDRIFERLASDREPAHLPTDAQLAGTTERLRKSARAGAS